MKLSNRIGIMLLILLSVGFTASATMTVVATHAVFGEFVQVVGGDLVNVVTIIPSGFCPSNYDLRPSDIAAVTHASLVIYSGFEPWMSTLLSGVGNKSVQTLQLKGDWNTPDSAAAKIDAIESALASLLPEDAQVFADNAATYKHALDSLAASLKGEADTLGVAKIPVICMQWQTSFVSWLGFDVVATYGIPANLSVKDLVSLAGTGKEENVRLVIDNLQSGIDFGAKLAREVAAVHVVLSNFPGAMPGTSTVLDLFKRNARSLFSAIEPL